MKITCKVLLLVVGLLLFQFSSYAQKESMQHAAEALVKRVVPDHAKDFKIAIIPTAENGHDVFEVESVENKIVLRGNDGVSVASALNWYLKNIGNCNLSWCGDRILLPKKLVSVTEKIRIINPHKYRVMFNYCTLNYTCSWWDQKRWERELDFLAMQGINTPLGVIGLEAVWYDTLLQYGFSDLEARSFLVAPAHSAWQWMTNIEGNGGFVPRSWVESRRSLGKWWMDRARSLGMTPIRQGFSGYVPKKLKEKFPDSSFATQGTWVGYPGSTQLDPLDPLFKKIGRTFMEVSLQNFGEGHLWAADPFHESAPPRPGDKYLNDVGTSIFSLMRELDPKAIWAMQSWSIRKPITDPVPKGSLLVLDLAGNKPGFWGHDYVKGQLHNFGGRINLHGDLRDIASNPFAERADKDPQCIGMGLFPEAIVQNPVFYELVYDMMWRDKPVAIDNWLHDYAQRRYGFADTDIDRAWKILLDEGPYKRGTSGVESSSMVAARPALVAKKSGPNEGFKMPYKPEKLVEALNILLSKSDKAGASTAYQYDVVDITRQALSNLLQEVHKEIRVAYLTKDRENFDKNVAQFDEILADIDKLLATRQEFLFGKWIADARSFGTTLEEKAYFEKDATMLVTIWGPEKTPIIMDYSWREWSGLINTYYRVRWSKFHEFLRSSIDQADYRDPKSQVHGRESFRANEFYDSLANWESIYVNSHHDLPSAPAGNPVEVAYALMKKYSPIFSEVYSPAARTALATNLAKVMAKLSSEGIIAGAWGAGEHFEAIPKTFKFQVADAVASNGEYEVKVSLLSGEGPVKVSDVGFVLNGVTKVNLPVSASLNKQSQEVTVRIKSGENLENSSYVLTVTLELASEKDRGEVFIRKIEANASN
jgi:alpha-N-acetylglucosaminidase